MTVLVIGGGGREHALAWKLAQSPQVTRVFVAPGNAGTATESATSATIANVPIGEDQIAMLLEFAKREKVKLTVVGPEVPLSLGIVDTFEAAGLRVFGPRRDAARLEASKLFCKEVLKRGNVPTALSAAFDTFRDAMEYLDAQLERPCVVKADGLAAGKGVTVCATIQEARDAVERLAQRREFGEAGASFLIEEYLEGTEVSVLAVTDGSTLVTLPPARDHKAAFDGGRGPNTGGMGAYSPVPSFDAATLQRVEETILVPTLHALRSMGITFRGVLYAGLMLTPQGPKVLEYNARFGDPECQTILMRLKSDLFEMLAAAADGRLEEIEPPTWDERSSVCVVMASAGYPGKTQTGFPIAGFADAESSAEGFVKIFHAGTAMRSDGRIINTGGRVLGITAIGDTIPEAKARAYAVADKINWEGGWMRRDISDSAVDSVQNQ